ncbi:MAG: OpgC domain-containing protein [Candidatus Sumerlaeia bacterium]|nr:OpgC domain-containing protein [Candidatus Sumerlaeia bacterium]
MTRDRSLDALRGVCVASMLLGHLAVGSVASRSAHLPLLLDGSSGFLALSGFLLGWRRSLLADEERIRNFNGRLLRRAALLYALHVAMVWALVAAERAGIRVPALGDAPASAGTRRMLAAACTFQLRPLHLTVLPLFIVCLPVGAAWSVAFARWGARATGVLAAASLAVYGWASVRPPGWIPSLDAAGAHSMFRILNWQAVFVLALACGAARGRFAPGTAPGAVVRWVAWPAAIALLIGSQSLRPSIATLWGRPPGWMVDAWFDRPVHAPGRLFYLAALAPVAYAAAERWLPERARLARTLEALGRHALPIYILHLPLIPLAAPALRTGYGRELAGLSVLAALLGLGWRASSRDRGTPPAGRIGTE